MLPTDTIRLLARRLYDARKSRTQLRHFSTEHGGMTIEDGYAIQSEWVRLEMADGRSIKGRKIGLTSRAMQQASQITEPDYAPLMDDMFFATGSDIPFERFIAPRVEVELAFVLRSPLTGPGVTLFDVLRATDYVTPALEIIDARIEQFDRPPGLRAGCPTPWLTLPPPRASSSEDAASNPMHPISSGSGPCSPRMP